MCPGQGEKASGDEQWGAPWVEGLIRRKPTAGTGLARLLSEAVTTCCPPHPAEPQLSLPFSPWPHRVGPAVAQVSGVCSFPVGCLGEAQDLSS